MKKVLKHDEFHFSKVIKEMNKKTFIAWFKKRFPADDAEAVYNNLHKSPPQPEAEK